MLRSHFRTGCQATKCVGRMPTLTGGFMKKALSVMLVWGFAIGIANAQNTATLIGTVADESNAVHPGTVVTATENSTGQQYTATSDQRGEYRMVEMQPGT